MTTEEIMQASIGFIKTNGTEEAYTAYLLSLGIELVDIECTLDTYIQSLIDYGYLCAGAGYDELAFWVNSISVNALTIATGIMLKEYDTQKELLLQKNNISEQIASLDIEKTEVQAQLDTLKAKADIQTDAEIKAGLELLMISIYDNNLMRIEETLENLKLQLGV